MISESGGLKNFIKGEFAKLKVMNFTDKRQYIWEYYRLQLLILAIIIIIAGFTVHSVLNPRPRDFVYVAWLTEGTNHEMLQRLSTNLTASVPDPERYMVSIFSYAPSPDPQVTMALQQRFFAMMQTGDLDIFIYPRQGAVEAALEGMIRPMTTVLAYLNDSNPALYAQIQDRLMVTDFSRMGTEIVVEDVMAISLRGAQAFIDAGINTADLYLSVAFPSNREANIATVLEYILRNTH